MKQPTRIALLALAALLVGAVSAMSIRNAAAHAPHPGLQFSIGIPTVQGCNTRASDVTCTLPAGQNFVVEVSLDHLPDDIPSYGGFDLYTEYAGVTPLQDAKNDVWPDCGFPAASYDADGVVIWGCAIGLPPAGPSSYIGPVGTITYTCTQNGSISLVHGDGDTDLVEAVLAHPDPTPAESIVHEEGNFTREKITINCGQVPANTPGVVTGGTPGGPGPTPGPVHSPAPGRPTVPGQEGPTLEPTAAAKATMTAAAKATATAKAGGTRATKTPGGQGGGGGGGSSSNTWVWIVIGVAAAVVVVGAGGGYWYYTRSRGGAPPTGGSSSST
jgi:hypothetical protein